MSAVLHALDLEMAVALRRLSAHPPPAFIQSAFVDFFPESLSVRRLVHAPILLKGTALPATLKSRLPQIIPEMAAKVSATVKWGAEMIAEDASALAPDATPYGEGLVSAIHVERAGAAEYAVVAGDEDVFWGHFQEFGTTKQAPQPFLIPAAEGRIGDIEAAVTAVLRGL